jgi:hypothetical protein
MFRQSLLNHEFIPTQHTCRNRQEIGFDYRSHICAFHGDPGDRFLIQRHQEVGL